MSMLVQGLSLLGAAERYRAKTRPASAEQRWCPFEPTERQRAFLSRTELEVGYGGAAGGGKSDALLMAALEYVDVPGYSALLLRRTYPELSQAEGLIDRSQEWLAGTGARWAQQTKTWHFPSGAKLAFGTMHRESDRYAYKGGVYHFVGYDELTGFTEKQYSFLFSRMRRRGSQEIPLRMRSATNPGGTGHAWVKARFGLDREGHQDDATAGQRPFIRALLDDNPHLDRDEYERSLSELDEETRLHMRMGVWELLSRGLVLPLAGHNRGVPLPEGRLRHVLAIDPGSSENDETYGISLIAWSDTVPMTVWVKLAEKHSRKLLSEHSRRIIEIGDSVGGLDAVVGDEGALGAQFTYELRRRYGIPIRAAVKTDRIGYARLLRDAARTGDLQLCGDTEALEDEAESLAWDEAGLRMVGTRHCYDATLYAWRHARAWRSRAPEDEPEESEGDRMEREDREAHVATLRERDRRARRARRPRRMLRS